MTKLTKLTKEQKLIKELTEALGYILIDGYMALDDIWDRGDDGFQDQTGMVDTALMKAKEYNEALYDEALKEPRDFVKNMDRDEDEEERDWL